MKITLKDGVVKEFDNAVSVLEIAKSISEGLARNACAGIVDGEVKDLRFVVDKDAEVSICTFEDEAGKMAFRHTASHILAQAVKRLYPEAKIAIGPAIADGFYYDFDREKAFTQEELEALEVEMKKIAKEDIPIERFELPRAEAIKYMEEREEPYKVELIQDLPEDAVISFYKQGDFTDLCSSDEHKDSEGNQADLCCRRLLERLRKEQNAFQNLRYCLPQGIRTGRISDNDGGSKEA